MNRIKKYFPLLGKQPELVYLDNAATTHKPDAMLQALNDYYINKNSNIGRGVYNLAHLSEECYNESKKTVASFIGCDESGIAYTSGCTESLNLAAHLAKQHNNKKYIILPISEHHANILIWQEIALQQNLELYWINDPYLILHPEKINSDILQNTSIFAIAHVSNVTGEIYPVEKWCKVAKDIGAVSVIDGAQAVTSIKVDITKIGCDFYAFSSHKLYGPMGLGVLSINNSYFKYKPFKLGGGIIENVVLHGSTLLDDVSKFEAGTPNVANAYAFAKTLDFLNEQNWKDLIDYTHHLGSYLFSELSKIGINPISLSDEFAKTHICSFVIPYVHAHDVGTFLAQNNIAVRVGKHCTFPLHKHLNIKSSVRASVGIYNTKEDIDKLIIAITDCIKYFSKDN